MKTLACWITGHRYTVYLCLSPVINAAVRCSHCGKNFPLHDVVVLQNQSRSRSFFIWRREDFKQ